MDITALAAAATPTATLLTAVPSATPTSTPEEIGTHAADETVNPVSEVIALGSPEPDQWAAAPQPSGNQAPPEVSALAAVVLDEASLEVLYEKSAHQPLPPASVTKIATAILLAEAGDLDRVVRTEIDSRAMVESSVMGLLPGDEFTRRDLLYGLMLPSGNDAALAIAYDLAGTEPEFAEEMTALARRLGLEDTHFMNAHGLDHPEHYTTAYDLAVLARYYMSIPVLREAAAALSWSAVGSRSIEMNTLNPLLYTYSGADGVKTGFTWGAGRTIVTSAVRDGHRVYVVLLNAPSMEADAHALFDWAFANHRWSEAQPSEAVAVKG